MNQLIDLFNVSRGWETSFDDPQGGIPWKAAPAGLSWIQEGFKIKAMPGARLGAKSVIGNWVSFGADSEVGNLACIGAGSTIEESALVGPGTKVGKECVIAKGCQVGLDVRIGDHSILRDHSSVGDGSTIGRACFFGEGTVVEGCCHIGDVSGFGEGCYLPSETRLGDRTNVGDKGRLPIDLGVVDGYRKTLCWVEGEPYIAAGCRWLPLYAAFEHWNRRNTEVDRRATLAMLHYARALDAINRERVEDDLRGRLA